MAKINDDKDIYYVDNTGNLKPVNFSSFGFANNTSGTTNSGYYTLANLPSWHTVEVNGSPLDYTNLVIDGSYKGERHYLALGTFSIETYSNDYQHVNHNIYAENMDIYGSSYYGLVWGNAGNNYTIETFDNINYYGAQLAYNDTYTRTIIKNNTTVYSLYHYRVPNDTNLYTCQGGSKGDQQNFQTNNIIFESGSVYKGYTYNGNAIELTGGATLKDGAEVNLFPHGNSAEHRGVLNEGMLIDGSKGTPSLQLYGSAKLNIDCNTQNLRNLIPTVSVDDNTSESSDSIA